MKQYRDEFHQFEGKKVFINCIARLHDIKVLAEGVETEGELRKVIEMGVDYIQGFFAGKPMPKPITVLPEEIKKVILDANGR